MLLHYWLATPGGGFMAPNSVTTEEYKNLVGTTHDPSPWITVDQQMISAFATITMDHNFIHTDAARVKNETSLSGTIAHGFLTASLLSPMAQQVLPKVTNARFVANYGMNRLRWISPVLSGARIRGHFQLSKVSRRKAGQNLLTHEVTVEIEGQEKPALKVQWLTIIIQNG